MSSALSGSPDVLPDIAVVIVTYDSAHVIGDLLDSLPGALDGLTADVVVVDNGSSDGTADLVAAGVPVGLGVDGSASNEDSSMLAEAHQAVLMARAVGGPAALTVRGSLSLATMGGAQVVGRADEIGSLEVGKLADLALWRLDGQPHAGVADPVAALVLGPRPPLALLLVNGQVVVEADELQTIDEAATVRAATKAAAALM